MRALERLKALAAPFVAAPAVHALRLWREPAYRRHFALSARLAGMPRRSPAIVQCDGLRIELADADSFLSAHNDIFVEQIYRFPFDNDAPSIVDLGANIGLATLWFKRQYPRARILAVEPDPAIFACLERNVRGNGFSDVELVNGAVWSADTELVFLPDGADGGRAVESSGARETTGAMRVKGIAADRLLDSRPVDFLKMDIEGAEDVVIEACRPLLPRVRRLFVEYHARKAAAPALGGIVKAIEAAGFLLHVENVGARRRPFVAGEARGAFSMQLNLFAWRRP
jgi:FkbM family methyltransferase